MATKRSVSSEPGVSSGAAPARAKNTVTRKHRSSAAAEISGSDLAPSSSPEFPTGNAVSYDQIAQLAYSFWESRGYQGGTPEEDWLRAERELTLPVA